MKQILNNITNKYASKWLVLLADIVIVSVSFFLAHLIRYNFVIDFDFELMLKRLPYVASLAAIVFIIVGSHKGVVRFTGFKDIVNIIIGTNIVATVLLLISLVIRRFDLNSIFNIYGSIIYIHLLINILMLVGFKLFVKSFYNYVTKNDQPNAAILIYGAGISGMLTYDVIKNDTKANYFVKGFIDDDKGKIGKKIDLVKVYAFKDIDENFITKHQIEEVIISIQNLESVKLLEISSIFFKLGIKVKIVPPAKHWIDGDLNLGQIKDIKIEDLLGREPIVIENAVLQEEYSNQVILITGAAGSIGSEIARKITGFDYKQLILIDNGESALYDLEQEFKLSGKTNIISIVADVRNADRIDQLFATIKPKIVFHAAAYKHVPLMESNPFEAVTVNVIGTKNIVDLSVKHAVNKFVLISTDKAVNPTNVMGASKRIAELYINSLNNKGQTKFITTRFGNVLGSNGSVIPLFKKQIAAGGPITVTHPEITRFFMTISEACQLVIEAAVMGNGGEIFVFDMGKSVRIFDLALNMIILSGLKYPNDIDIKITGLRPGEKIYEELLANNENTKPTYHEKIMIAKAQQINNVEIASKIEDLLHIKTTMNNLEIVSKIKEIVPEYLSKNSKYEVLDPK